ncbi:Transposon Tf2-11 polyprotein [Dictyocoela muelleri]|nr:Transposon Tf2-11 polyprotein [Dictyocoela muelleri]
MENVRQKKSRLENFVKWENPSTKKQLQKLLGKINRYRNFIPNISLKLKNLYDILKIRSTKISIKDDKMKPVQEIYDLIYDKIYLFIPDINKKIIIHSDSSKHTIGAVLNQYNGVIDHYSKKLNPSQMNYSIVENEMFAIYMSVMKWK